jgi:hypothetical protein
MEYKLDRKTGGDIEMNVKSVQYFWTSNFIGSNNIVQRNSMNNIRPMSPRPIITSVAIFEPAS